MPKYRCKKCRAVWYGWGTDETCPQCEDELEPILKQVSTSKK